MRELLKFLDLLHQLQLVKRAVLARAENRYENDLEHSYQLAMTGWYIVAKESLDLNVVRIIQYALVHDVVEAYAGDTPTYSGNREEQARRESRALAKLREKFPEFRELHQATEEYEKRDSRESKFVYALDKLLPILINYQDGGRNWKSNGITLAMLLKHKTKDISLSPEVQKYYDQIVERLRESERDLFKNAE